MCKYTNDCVSEVSVPLSSGFCVYTRLLYVNLKTNTQTFKALVTLLDLVIVRRRTDNTWPLPAYIIAIIVTSKIITHSMFSR